MQVHCAGMSGTYLSIPASHRALISIFNDYITSFIRKVQERTCVEEGRLGSIVII